MNIEIMTTIEVTDDMLYDIACVTHTLIDVNDSNPVNAVQAAAKAVFKQARNDSKLKISEEDVNKLVCNIVAQYTECNHISKYDLDYLKNIEEIFDWIPFPADAEGLKADYTKITTGYGIDPIIFQLWLKTSN